MRAVLSYQFWHDRPEGFHLTDVEKTFPFAVQYYHEPMQFKRAIRISSESSSQNPTKPRLDFVLCGAHIRQSFHHLCPGSEAVDYRFSVFVVAHHGYQPRVCQAEFNQRLGDVPANSPATASALPVVCSAVILQQVNVKLIRKSSLINIEQVSIWTKQVSHRNMPINETFSHRNMSISEMFWNKNMPINEIKYF